MTTHRYQVNHSCRISVGTILSINELAIDESECPICMRTFFEQSVAEAEPAIRLNYCCKKAIGHNCLLRCIGNEDGKTTCPLCRADLSSQDVCANRPTMGPEAAQVMVLGGHRHANNAVDIIDFYDPALVPRVLEGYHNDLECWTRHLAHDEEYCRRYDRWYNSDEASRVSRWTECVSYRNTLVHRWSGRGAHEIGIFDQARKKYEPMLQAFEYMVAHDPEYQAHRAAWLELDENSTQRLTRWWRVVDARGEYMDRAAMYLRNAMTLDD